MSFLTSSAGYSPLIDQPTHITKESSSCIDLIFTSNPSFISASGVELSLYEKCHHNLIYGKINFNVPLPQPYIREVWDSKNAVIENIHQSVSGIDWDFMFQGKPVNQKVNILNECLLNVFHNFIPNKQIKFNCKDPPWMTETVKSKLRERSNLVKRYYKNGNKNTDLEKALTKSNECTEIIVATNENYINELSKKLSNPETAPKTYWKILNRFLSNKKIPSIPPLLVNREMISNFSKKAEVFNKFFASQCTPSSNTSTLPPLTIKTDKRLSSLKINEDDILSIIKSLNSNKSHGWDKLSIRIKMCNKTLVYPLKLIFKASIQEGVFQDC